MSNSAAIRGSVRRANVKFERRGDVEKKAAQKAQDAEAAKQRAAAAAVEREARRQADAAGTAEFNARLDKITQDSDRSHAEFAAWASRPRMHG